MHWFPQRLSGSEDLPPPSHSHSKTDGARDDAAVLDAYSAAVIHVVEKVAPAVISVTGRNQESGSGSGSGFIVSREGHAVTNSHVVAGRSQLVAMTNDGDRVEAAVLGDDPATDIALLRLSSSDMPHVNVGDSTMLRVGQLVIAMGSPLGLQSTVSTGIASGTGRSMRSQTGQLIDSIIQHSAPINPGNSGGPLLDTQGNVVGVNTAVIAMAQGIGFAVPSNTAQWVTQEILAHGSVRRRQLGIVVSSVRLSRAEIRAYDLLTEHCVVIAEVVVGGVAQRAGLRPDDLIVNMNGRIVESPDDLHRLLSLFPMERSIEVGIVRGGKPRTIEIPGADSINQ